MRIETRNDFRVRRDGGDGLLLRLRCFFAGFDFVQFMALITLCGAGLLFIHSTGIQIGTPSARLFFFKQVQWVTLGGILWFAASLIDYRQIHFRLFALLFYFASLVLLVLVFFIGTRVYGAQSWIRIFGLNLQPSEFSKLAVVVLLSAMFSTPMFNVNRLPCLLLGAIVVAIPFGLILKEPDFGSAIILLPTFLLIIFCAGLKWRYIIVTVVMALLVGGAAILNEAVEFRPLLKDYQRARIRVFLRPETDLMHRGYNQYQARLAVGSGGLWGKGIGQGTQNTLGFLPQTVSNNDFIFSVIAEEVGFAGCLVLLLAYLALFYSILRTAFTTSDPFGRYIAIGMVGIIFTHTYINIGMSIGLMPVTGVPLPFVSYGGSFVLMGLTGCGILQSVYRYRDTGN